MQCRPSGMDITLTAAYLMRVLPDAEQSVGVRPPDQENLESPPGRQRASADWRTIFASSETGA